MLLRGIVRMGMARRLNAHRVLSLALCSLALVGWGAFVDLRAELAQLKASQDQLLAERIQQQEAGGRSDPAPSQADVRPRGARSSCSPAGAGLGASRCCSAGPDRAD